jgi:hypothetical protein
MPLLRQGLIRSWFYSLKFYQLPLLPHSSSFDMVLALQPLVCMILSVEKHIGFTAVIPNQTSDLPITMRLVTILIVTNDLLVLPELSAFRSGAEFIARRTSAN